MSKIMGVYMLSDEMVVQNWDRLLSIIEEEFPTRKEQLLKLYNDLTDRISLAPASPKKHWHSAFPGGYVHHVLKVYDIGNNFVLFLEDMGLNINFTEEELKFCLINHDLGKVGDLENPYYVESIEHWKVQRGEPYSYNSVIPPMPVPDRSLFLLQSYGIPVSMNEWRGIASHDGMYDEKNKVYLFDHKDFNIHIAIHTADMLAVRLEYQEFMETQDGNEFQLKKVKGYTQKTKPGRPKKSVLKTTFKGKKDGNGLSWSDEFNKLFDNKEDGE